MHTYTHTYIHIKQQMGNWPARKEDLITKHKKEFYEYFESIDIDNLIV